MKNSIVFVLCLFSFLWASAQTCEHPDFPYIETIASADTVLVPDLIYLSLEISQKDVERDVYFDNLDALVSNELRAIGIDTDAQFFNSPFSSNIVIRNISNLVMYTKSYELVIYEAKQIGEVVEALQELGKFTYSIIGTDHSQLLEIEMEIRQKAASRGKLQAEAMLNAAGGKLGSLVYLADTGDLTRNLSTGAISVDSKFRAEINDVTIKPIVVNSNLLMRFKIE